MKKAAFAMAAVTLSICFGLPLQKANTSTPATDERGPVSADINDSDEFFQSNIRSGGVAPDNSQRVEALLKRMIVGVLSWMVPLYAVVLSQLLILQLYADKLDLLKLLQFTVLSNEYI